MAKRLPYYIAFVLWIVSFVLCSIAYGTGYWFEADKGGDDRLFRRLGLWEACFDGYEHTSDYIGKAYYGCWWIFHKEYSYIRDWIMPPWFIAVQTLMTFALVFEFTGLALFPLANHDSVSTRNLSLTCALTGLTTACIGISVVIFGVMVGEDRTWMPRPDIDVLGWSFGLAVVSGFMSAFSCISITIYTLMRKYELLPKADQGIYHHGEKMNQPKAMPMVPLV